MNQMSDLTSVIRYPIGDDLNEVPTKKALLRGSSSSSNGISNGKHIRKSTGKHLHVFSHKLKYPTRHDLD